MAASAGVSVHWVQHQVRKKFFKDVKGQKQFEFVHKLPHSMEYSVSEATLKNQTYLWASYIHAFKLGKKIFQVELEQVSFLAISPLLSEGGSKFSMF